MGSLTLGVFAGSQGRAGTGRHVRLWALGPADLQRLEEDEHPRQFAQGRGKVPVSGVGAIAVSVAGNGPSGGIQTLRQLR